MSSKYIAQTSVARFAVLTSSRVADEETLQFTKKRPIPLLDTSVVS